MAHLNVTLSSATIQVVDTTTSTTKVNSSLGNPSLGSGKSSYFDFLPIAIAGTVITLPATTVFVVCIRNLGGIDGAPSGNITVRAQATGGALPIAVDAPLVLPNGLWIYWQPATTAGGIVALTLVASVDLTPVELLMAA